MPLSANGPIDSFQSPVRIKGAATSFCQRDPASSVLVTVVSASEVINPSYLEAKKCQSICRRTYVP